MKQMLKNSAVGAKLGISGQFGAPEAREGSSRAGKGGDLAETGRKSGRDRTENRWGPG